jgi:hypothetical protein
VIVTVTIGTRLSGTCHTGRRAAAVRQLRNCRAENPVAMSLRPLPVTDELELVTHLFPYSVRVVHPSVYDAEALGTTPRRG